MDCPNGRIFIFTALYCEASAVIQRYGLVRNAGFRRFQVFADSEDKIILTITGAGGVPASIAVSCIGTAYEAGRKDFLINIGICAQLFGRRAGIYLCNKIIERPTGRTFYPDMLYRYDFTEKCIVSDAVPVRRSEENGTFFSTEKDELYDMEAAAVFQAGAYFFAPHHMSFLKAVSDSGQGEKVSPADAASLMEGYIEEISGYINGIINISEAEVQCRDTAVSEEMACIDRLCEDMHCSQVMRASLRQYLWYCSLAQISWRPIADEMYADGKLPCSSKREGKRYFEEFKGKLL